MFKEFIEELYKKDLSWDQYFMILANIVATRSSDISTKHGSIIVDQNKRIISTGYNGPIQGIDDKHVPKGRPDKYPWMIHSEDNAILFAKQDLHGFTIYVTGRPCVQCTRRIIQSGISKVIYGDRGSHCIDEFDRKHADKMISLGKTKFEKFDGELF